MIQLEEIHVGDLIRIISPFKNTSHAGKVYKVVEVNPGMAYEITLDLGNSIGTCKLEWIKEIVFSA